MHKIQVHAGMLMKAGVKVFSKKLPTHERELLNYENNIYEDESSNLITVDRHHVSHFFGLFVGVQEN